MKKRIISAVCLMLCASMLAGCSNGGTSSNASSNAETSATQNTESASSQGGETSKTETTKGDETSAPETSAPEESSSTAGGNNHVGVDGVETNGQLVVDIDGHTWGISLYGGGTGDNYASYVNEFKEKVGSGVNVFSMVVPTAGAYYLPSNYDGYNASHRDTVNNIANNLKYVINVDGYGVLEKHTDEYIYTRTDHHWMPLGAYYCAKEFCEMAGVPAKDLSTYTPETIEGFVGTMYAFTDYNERINNDPDTFTYYIPSTGYEATYYTTDFQIDEDVKYYTSIFVDQPASGAYSTFMGGDRKIVKIKTENENGRKLCIFKDSYGNATVPFLIDSFEEIYVCDVRYFDVNGVDFIEQNDITDVLFTMCTFSAVGENAEGIKNNILS